MTSVGYVAGAGMRRPIYGWFTSSPNAPHGSDCPGGATCQVGRGRFRLRPLLAQEWKRCPDSSFRRTTALTIT